VLVSRVEVLRALLCAYSPFFQLFWLLVSITNLKSSEIVLAVIQNAKIIKMTQKRRKLGRLAGRKGAEESHP
jgi:hypothetical protein